MRARLVPSGISIRANTHNSRMVGDPEVIADVSLSLIKLPYKWISANFICPVRRLHRQVD